MARLRDPTVLPLTRTEHLMKKATRKGVGAGGHPACESPRTDTAEYCRAKAHDLVHTAIQKALGEERALLERSAAAWSMRAEQLHRSEARLAAEQPQSGSGLEHVRLRGAKSSPLLPARGII